MSNPVFYATLMLMAGFGIPVMASLNSGLGMQLGSPTLATTLLFAIGLSVCVIYLLNTDGLSAANIHFNIPWYFYCGGILVAFYILSITWVAPKFGVGNAISFILLGQLFAISLIDHFGWFGVRQSALNLSRLIGIVLMIAGVFLVVRRAN